MLEFLPKGQFDVIATNYTPGSIISGIIGTLLVTIAVAFLFVVIIAGIVWITSADDPERKRKARAWLINGIAGLFAALAMWAVLNLIGVTVNLPGVTEFGLPTLSSPGGSIEGEGIPRGGGGDDDDGDGGSPAPTLPPTTGGGTCPLGGACKGQCASAGEVGPICFGDNCGCYVCTTAGWQLTEIQGCKQITNCKPCDTSTQ